MTSASEHALQPTTAVEIRTLTELSEFDVCVAIETAVWGYDPGDMIPRRMFLLADRIGGQVLGAIDSATSGAFNFAPQAPLWSDPRLVRDDVRAAADQACVDAKGRSTPDPLWCASRLRLHF